MVDVRQSTNEEMLIVYNKFKSIKPHVTWYDERPTLTFKNKTQTLIIESIYFIHGALRMSFYPAVILDLMEKLILQKK